MSSALSQDQNVAYCTAREPATQPPQLLDRVREVLRMRHYSLRTEECYVQWIRRYIFFHHARHPLELGGGHIEEFLTHLAVMEKGVARTASPLDYLDEVTVEEMATAATRSAARMTIKGRAQKAGHVAREGRGRRSQWW